MNKSEASQIGIGSSIEEGVSLPKIGHMTYNLIAFFKTFSVLYGLGWQNLANYLPNVAIVSPSLSLLQDL